MVTQHGEAACNVLLPDALTVCSHSDTALSQLHRWSAGCLPELIAVAGWLLLSGLSCIGWSSLVYTCVQLWGCADGGSFTILNLSWCDIKAEVVVLQAG